MQPALLAVSVIPGFDGRFTAAMLHLRDELLILDGDKVGLAEDFQKRLPEVMLAGLKQA